VGKDQTSFFDQLESFSKKGRDFFGGRIQQTIQGSGGGLLGSLMLPLAGSGEPIPQERRGVDRDQLKLQINDRETLLNLFPKLTIASKTFERQIAETNKEVDVLSRTFDRLDEEGRASSLIPTQLDDLADRLQRLQREQREWVVTTRDSELAAERLGRALRAAGVDIRNVAREVLSLRRRFDEGPISGRQTDAFFENEAARLRVRLRQASSFDERNDIERQIKAMSELKTSLRELGIEIKDLESIGRRLNLSTLIEDKDNTLASRLRLARREADALGDALGERGSLGRARHIFRSIGGDVHRTIPILRRFRIAQKDAFDPADLTNFDETLSIGFRRIARLLAVFSVLLPFLTVGIGALLGAVVGLVGGVTALAGAFGALAGVLATLPGLFAATYGAIFALTAVLGPALRDISERFSEIIQLEDQARKNTTENANAVRDAEEALADVRIQNAQQVADIEERIAETRLQTAESVADQERDLARLKRDNAEEEMDLVRDLRRAKRDAADDAREAEQRYQEVVSQNRADEQDIMRELSARRAALSGAIASGDPAAIAGAQASVSAWETTLRKEQAENRKEEATALKAVTQAKVDGAEEIADLERKIARTKRDNNEQELDSERRLARTRRDSAKQLIDLEQQRQQLITQGIRQERDAMQRLTEARRSSTVDIQDSLEGLTEAEKGVVKQLLRIRETWLQLTAATREGGVRFIGEALTALEEKLPEIANGLNAITEGLLGVGRQALERFTSPERWGRFSRILEDTRDNAVRIAEALVEVADAFLTLADAARPLTDRLTRGLRNAALEFNSFIQEQDKAGGLDEFFGATDRVLTLVVESVKNLGEALFDVLVIAEPFGEILLGDFLEWTEGIREWTSSPTGMKALEDFFRDSVPIVEALADFVDELVQALFRVGRELIRPDELSGLSLFQEVIEDLTGALPRLEEFLISSFRVNGPIVIKFLREFGKFMGVLVGPGGAIVQFLAVLSEVLRVINDMPDFLVKLIFTYLTFHGAIFAVSKALGRLSLAFAATKTAGQVAVSRNVLFGVGIAAMLAFPGVVDPMIAALRRFQDVLEPLTDKLYDFAAALGVSEQGVNDLALTLLFLTVVLKRAGIVAIITSIGGLVRAIRLFFTLIGSIGALRAFAAAFPRLSGALLRLTSILPRLVAAFVPLLAALGPAGWVALGIIALGTAVAIVLIKFESVRAKVLEVLNWIRDNWWKLLIAAFVRPFPLLVVLFFKEGAKLGQALAEGIWEGIKGLGGWLKDRIGGWLGGILPNIDVPGFSPPKEAAGEAIGAQMARGVREYFARGMEGFEQDIGKEIEDALNKVQETALTTEDEVQRTTASNLAIAYSAMQELLAAAEQNLESFRSSLSSLESSIPAFIRGRMTQQDVPAAREIAQIQRQEVIRQRAQTRQDANTELQEARRVAREREQTVAVAQTRLARLQRRVGTGAASLTPAQRRAAARESGGLLTLTPAQRRALAAQNAAVRAQERVLRDRKRELADAEASVREVAKRRAETYRQVAQEERLERLEILAETQRQEREKEIAAAGRRATEAVKAIIKAWDAGKIDARNARRRLIKVLLGAGATAEEANAWLKAGSLAGEDFGSGLIDSLHQVFLDLPNAIKAELQKARLAAVLDMPAVIITDVNAIRALVLTGRPNPNKGYLGRGGGGRAAGGLVYGQEGAGVPIMAHAGEWVLNRSQQTRMAMMAGLDRSVLERALFHLVPVGKQGGTFAMGGVIPSFAGGGSSTQFLTPINIQTASPTVDAEYVARSLESRMRLAAG
jgi:hypothetical protein